MQQQLQQDEGRRTRAAHTADEVAIQSHKHVERGRKVSAKPVGKWEKVGEKVEGKGGGQKPGKIRGKSGKIREALGGEEKRGYGSGSATSCP